MKQAIQTPAVSNEMIPASEALSSENIRWKIEQQKIERDSAEADAKALRDATTARLLHSSNEEMEVHDAAIREADRRKERADKFIELLKPELEAALHREDQARRWAVFNEALDAHDEAKKLIFEEYPELAAPIVKLLERLTEIEKQVNAANDYRPEGVQYIRFEHFRGEKGNEARYSEVTETYYVDASGNEISPIYKVSPSGRVIDTSRCIAKTRKQNGTYHPASPDQFPTHLRKDIHLPGVKLYDPPFWQFR